MRRPLGHETRGKTAPGRLRRLDAFVCAVLPEVLRAPGHAPYVDLGFGWLPLTTMDSARAFRRLNPTLEVIGTEIVLERVEAAVPWADARTRFLHGGFDVRIEPLARLVRAANVLRQYDESEVQPAWEAIGRGMAEGAWLLEGTSDPSGRVAVFNTLQKRGGQLIPNGLLFSLSSKEAIEPSELAQRLPKNLIHRNVPGEPVHRFLSDWTRIWRSQRHLEAFGRRHWWAMSARALAEKWPIDRRSWLARHGFVWLKEPL